MSSGDMMMEEPLSKKTRLSPGPVATRNSMDFGVSDIGGLPDELLFDSPSSSAPTSNGIPSRVSLSNGPGPSSSSSLFSSSSGGGSSMYTPSPSYHSMPTNQYTDSSSNAPSVGSTVLKNLLQGDSSGPTMMPAGTGPRSVPTSAHANANASPQRPPTAPGVGNCNNGPPMAPNFANRSPMNNHMMSPPNNGPMSRNPMVPPRTGGFTCTEPVTMTVAHNSAYTITTMASGSMPGPPRVLHPSMVRPQMNGSMGGPHSQQIRMLQPGPGHNQTAPHMNMPQQRHQIRSMHPLPHYANGPNEFGGMNGNGPVMIRHDNSNDFMAPSPIMGGGGGGPLMTSPHYGNPRPQFSQAGVNPMPAPSNVSGVGHMMSNSMDASQSPLPGGNIGSSMMPISQSSHMSAYPPGPSPGQPSGLFAPSGPGAMPASQNPGHNTQDPEKRKLIQQQLVLLLHAHKCQLREQENGQQRPCDLPHCSTMKGVLNHMINCEEGRACTFTHCASSRQIIQHWKNCERADCPVCLPLKIISNDKRQGGQTGMEHIQLAMRATAGGDSPNNNGPLMNRNTPGPFGANSAGGPLVNAASVLNVGAQGGCMSFQGRLPPPEGATVEKIWHKDVNLDLRNHLVGKLVKAIFPSPDPAAIKDDRIRELINYARKVEKEMFEQANDREEYYHLLAEKIYKIQKELQEKKQKRLEAAMIQSGGAPPTNGASNVTGILGSLDMHAPPNRTAPSELALNNVSQPCTSSLPSQTSPNTTPSSTPWIKSEPGKDINNSQQPIAAVKSELMSIETIKKEELMDSSDAPPRTNATSLSKSQETTGGEKKAEVSGAGKEVVKKEVTPKEPAKRKEFDVNELRQHLMPIWDKLNKMDESIPFRFPVDPELLHIPDYFDIIKKPMDLSTMHEKMNRGDYRDPWQFCDHMWLMFENAWLYNRKNSKVYKFCTKLSEVFTDMIDPVMAELGYCCGRRLAFTPLALFCYGQAMCTIPRDAIYVCYEKRSAEYGLNVIPERYTYCPKCFENQPECINLSDDPTNPEMVAKDKFLQLKNDAIEYEPFVDCTQCGRKWHQICGLHNDKMFPGGFVCKTCRRELSKPRIENRFTAKRLPQNVLSKHMEERVNRHLRTKGSNAGEVIIRVLASSDKEVEVKQNMKNRYCACSGGSGDIPEKFPYRTKAIFAFENINGEEVCFFGLHVQEYGADCPTPNTRRVYIAYLDSVHYFQPREYRTSVYHEILLGYLEYVKASGYVWAHIWACPPSEGDDYIFHCHPPEQKIPKPKRLQEWYKRMLDKGIVERTVTDYKDIYKQAVDDKIASPAEMPYFEGDFWPNVIEDCIREADTEEQERRKEMEAQALADHVDEVDDDTFDTGMAKKKNPKNPKKSNKKQKAKASKKKIGGAGSGNELTDKLLQNLEKHKEVFFTIRLQTVHNHNQKISDPDQLIQSELMDGRDTFLARCRDEHWEFSSLRRAKYSTMCLCYALHMQGGDQFVYTCNNCKGNNARWHCPICPDFDLCDACKKCVTHDHKMEPINSLLNNEQDGDPGKQDQNSRNESIQRCIQSLVHACQCRDVNCRRLSCHKMKRVVSHTKGCKKRQSGSCPVCKQLIALCCYHAKHCNDQTCQVPFCMNIRQKLHEQKQHQRRQQERKMMRRMAMQGLINNPGAAPPTQQSTPSQPSTPVLSSASVSQSTLFAPNQAGPSGANPPAGAMQAVQEVQRFAEMSSRNPGPGHLTTQASYSNPPTNVGGFLPQQRTISMPANTNNQRMSMHVQQSAMQPGQMQQQVSWDGQSQRMVAPNGPNNGVGDFVGPGGPAGPPRMQHPGDMPGNQRPPLPNQGQGSRFPPEMMQKLMRLKSAQTKEEAQICTQELANHPIQLAELIRMRGPQRVGAHSGTNMGQPMQGQSNYGGRGPMISNPRMTRPMLMQQQQQQRTSMMLQQSQGQGQFQQNVSINMQQGQQTFASGPQPGGMAMMGPPNTFRPQHIQQQHLMNQVRSPQGLVRSPQPPLTSPSHMYPLNPSPASDFR